MAHVCRIGCGANEHKLLDWLQNSWGGPQSVMQRIVDRATSRRRFIKFLSQKPAVRGHQPCGARRGGPVPRATGRIPIVWAPRDYDHLIASPKEALDVFDFEPVMHKNVPAAHFGYMASGVDDDVTLRANREGFLEVSTPPAAGWSTSARST